ncbi:unnamed protein product [Adineta ricciae]|uniref:G-protein coupled receptors family 1 profile domain-containing protein n=1 Tax=Adineta ricciae TaxID=249248 RepID=A0A814RSS9_ADIRI|nr:unnamed protein product [Adineta ricciae]
MKNMLSTSWLERNGGNTNSKYRYHSNRIHTESSLPITKLCLGTLYKKQCSAQTPIPIWLVTSGFRGLFCIFVTLSILGFAVLTDRYCRKTSSSLLLFMGTLIIVISAFFNFAWSILGIYWSTSIRSTIQHTDPTQTQTYCHSTPYTFVMVVSLFQAITILIFIVICVIYIRRALPTMITYSNGQAVHQAHKQYGLYVAIFILSFIFLT